MKFFYSQIKLPTKDKEDDVIVLSIKEDLKKARYALESAYLGFDNATDPDLIDCYIYEVNAELKRYKYLMNLYRAANPDAYLEEKEVKPNFELTIPLLCQETSVS